MRFLILFSLFSSLLFSERIELEEFYSANSKSKFYYCKFINCDLDEANFDNCDLYKTQFINCDLKDAKFKNVCIENIIFKESINEPSN